MTDFAENNSRAELSENPAEDSNILTVLFFADIVGKPGRHAMSYLCKRLREQYRAEMVIANVENAAGGFGVTPEMSKKIFKYGVDVQTSGNHIWDRMDVQPYIRYEKRLIRPANYPSAAPGNGSYVFELFDTKVAVINVMGRTFMNISLDCPFRTVDSELAALDEDVKIRIVDFHAEASSEKQGMLHFLDGRVSAIIGTHTHVQTADEKVTAGGTAYIGDIGMTGPHDSMLGMQAVDALGRFLTGLPKRLSCASGDVKACGVSLKINKFDGKARSIERFQVDFDAASIDGQIENDD